MWFTVHLVSIGAAAGAIVVLTFLLFTMAFLVYFTHNRVYLHYLVLQASFLPYLVGFAMYTSGTDHGWVMLWFKVCVTGLMVSPFFLEFFLESLLNVRRPVHRLVIGLVSLVFLAVLWAQPWMMATGEIVRDVKGFTSVVKGPAFPLFSAAAMGSVVFSIGWFCRRVFSTPRLWRQYLFILIGLSIWFLSIVLDALVALKFFDVITAPWLGPVAMVIAVGLHLGVLVERSFAEIRRQMKENEQLRHRLRYDPLTRLYSREFFNTILEIEAEAWARNPQDSSILFIDADNFKGINDQFGHSAGDRVLEAIGDIIRSNVRRSDIPSRYGGDEFIILLKNCTRDAARILGEKIINEYTLALKELFPEMPDGFSGLSIGVAGTSVWATGKRDLIAVADEAMYRSKRHGKNRVVVAEAAG